ncbi:hypothetical protein Dimus_003841, partial [Dionaea muscipula]
MAKGRGRPWKIVQVPKGSVGASSEIPSDEGRTVEEGTDTRALGDATIMDLGIERGGDLGDSRPDSVCGLGESAVELRDAAKSFLNLGPNPQFLRAVKTGCGMNVDEEQTENSLARNRDTRKGLQLSCVDCREEEIIISADAVAAEMRYWGLALISYVLGDRVSFSAMEGFVRSQWKEV